MSRYILLILLSGLLINNISSQTLFTYGKNTADAKDFLRAFNKNNTSPVQNKSKAIRDYLDLYINSRLKIQEAYERKYDTLPQIKTEVENLRNQIVENYMNDPEIANRLTTEAFQRSLKDIHVGHIFISFKNATGQADTLYAQKKRDSVLQQLQKGIDFLELAQQTSDDPSAKKNKGDLGYITVFTLPYEFENGIYSTPVGKYSKVIQSKIGYHIFKNLGERKAAGKIKAQQILLAIPPGSSEADKKQIASKADSIYKRILAGDNFNSLATQFSNDYISGNAGGQMQDISVGQYDPVFEKELWSLPKDGAVSKPFQTSHGWHIIKRNSIINVVTNTDDKANKHELLQKIMQDTRWKSSGDFIYKKIMVKPGYKKYPYDDASFFNFSDSILDSKTMKEGWAIKDKTPLFAIGDSVYYPADWINYARAIRFKPDGTGPKPWEQAREEWVQYAMLNYYKDHLESYNDEFRNQMKEFKDGNLFFEIMQQEIWNKAQNDSNALKSLYEKNKSNYIWKQSVDAVIFYCSDETIAKTAFEEIKKKPSDWRKVVDQYAEKIVADASKFEWDQIPNLNKQNPAAGMITSPLLNNTDNTASFAYIINTYPQPTQRNYSEAKGMVINDYQALLEKQWDEVLKKKFPIVINQKVLAEISR